MSYRDNALYQRYKRYRTFKKWAAQGFASPAPQQVKEAVFERNGIRGATWVETGTFKGNTTQFLSSIGSKVYSLEPAKGLFEDAAKRFQRRTDVEIINGHSEDVFPQLVPTLSGDVCFWLDGHYSAGSTFQGERDTPILQELAAIKTALPQFSKLAVMIDDVRCFDPNLPEYKDYPALGVLTDWAEELNLKWHIEHDIFVAAKL